MRLIFAIHLLSSLILSVFSNPIPSLPFSSRRSLSSAPYSPSLSPPTTENYGVPHHPDVELVRRGDPEPETVRIIVIGPSPDEGDGSVRESIVRMMSYVTSKKRVHVHVLITTNSFDDTTGTLKFSNGLAYVERAYEEVKGVLVLALPTVVVIDDDSMARLEKLEASGINIVARARRPSKFKYPKSVLRVAPPGKDETFHPDTATDLWVHTSPENWADAILRAAGVMAESLCDPTKTPIKEAVIKLGQKRDPRGKANFLVMPPLIPTKYPLSVEQAPIPWKVEVPSRPWISYVDLRTAYPSPPNAHSNSNIHTGEIAVYSQPHLPLPRLREAFAEQLPSGWSSSQP